MKLRADISKAPVAAGKYPLSHSEKSSLGMKGIVLSTLSAIIFLIQSARKVDKQFKLPWQPCDTGDITGLRPTADFK